MICFALFTCLSNTHIRVISRVSSQKLPSIVTGGLADNLQATPGIPERKICVKGTGTAFEKLKLSLQTGIVFEIFLVIGRRVLNSHLQVSVQHMVVTD